MTTQNIMTQGPPNHAVVESLAGGAARLQHRVRSAGELPRAEGNERLQQAAQDFEALFITYILKVMRETIMESGLTGEGFGRSVYTELFDQEVARCIADRGSFGIADMIVRSIGEQGDGTGESSDDVENVRSSVPSRSPADRGAPSAPSPHAGGGSAGEEIPDFRLPVQAPVSSEFGFRKDPIHHGRRFHKGIDIAAPEGMDVRAALGGRVVFAGYEGGYGNTVLVEHPGGYRTRYAHLGTMSVRAGEQLRTEQVLGTVGSTGRSTGPHLHFEVSRLGEMIDPLAALADE